MVRPGLFALVLLGILLASCARQADAIPPYVFTDQEERWIPDAGQRHVTFRVPDYPGFVLERIEVKLSIWHEFYCDLYTYMEYRDSIAVLCDCQGTEEYSPYVNWFTTWRYDGFSGGDSMVLTVRDWWWGDEGIWSGTEVVVHYRPSR